MALGPYHSEAEIEEKAERLRIMGLGLYGMSSDALKEALGPEGGDVFQMIEYEKHSYVSIHDVVIM